MTRDLLSHLIDANEQGTLTFAIELRPPRARLERAAGMDAWIDTYHAIRGIVRRGAHVCLTDSAVGTAEENNLRHLVTNLERDVPRERIVPFLTSKHPLDYCLDYAERARQFGFPALVVLGGDRHVGPPRCVEHAFQLRRAIRARQPDLVLGGWTNPHADRARQIDYLLDRELTAEFALTQIVSHHDRPAVERFVGEAARRGVDVPLVFGVFYYRSANPRTLATLERFLPVPARAISEEFARGASAAEVCARTVRGLLDVGVRHFYVSNLPLAGATGTLDEVLRRAGVNW